MKRIETPEEFEQMLALNKCLIFVAADWSGPSKMAEAKLNFWNKDGLTTIFCLNVDNELFTQWFLEESKRLDAGFYISGSGPLLFVNQGNVTDYVYPSKLEMSDLSQQVHRFFDYENHSNPAAG